MSVKVEFWGDYACFSRPELKVERMSYDVMTPSAARGMLEAIYWHPGLRWVIDRIYVCEPICFTGIRRNEVKDKIVAGDLIKGCRLEVTADGRTLRLFAGPRVGTMLLIR